MSNKTYKCPFCEKRYVEKQALYNHMENKHEEQLNGLPAAQVYFNIRNNKTGGKCIICKSPTEFNLRTEKYERLCNNPKCKEEYRKIFEERMKKAGKENQMNDPEHQKKMLANRKISGTYVWSSDKSFKFTYTASYEKDFLEFMDLFMNWCPSDLFMPSPIYFRYKTKKDGKVVNHTYIPDAFIPSLNLIIEIKSSTNNHYRERDIEIEKIKDNILNKSEYNYFKVFDKSYDDLFNYIIELIKKNQN